MTNYWATSDPYLIMAFGGIIIATLVALLIWSAVTDRRAKRRRQQRVKNAVEPVRMPHGFVPMEPGHKSQDSQS